MKINSLRGKWPLYLAIIISLAIAYYAYSNLLPIIQEKEAFTQSLVVSKEIKAFSVIDNNDLGYKKVLKTSLPANAIQDPDEIIGKVANTIISVGSPVYAKQLDDLKQHKDKQFISVPVDLSRAVGGMLRSGDIVDVYWVDSLENSMWRKIASNVIISEMLDSSGNVVSTIINATGIESRSVTPTIVVLAVDKSQVNALIGGSVADRQVVLVKKLTGDTLQETAPPQIEGSVGVAPTVQ